VCSACGWKLRRSESKFDHCIAAVTHAQTKPDY
jgi:hypothetical protein